MTAVMTEPRKVSFRVRDVTGQKSARIEDVMRGVTIGEILPSLLAQMSLPTMDDSGPLTHALRRDSDGAILNDSDFVEELADTDAVIQPSVNAGAR